MSVVIDEFEVVTNDEEGSPKSGASAGPSTSAGSPTAHDLERVVERRCERDERVWAH